ncbi:MAG: amidohydrolase family protein [Alphaproteobacteria bacterium]|nr:amidohydrolase family protein [Alphaproteobacteria bacterium]
MRLFIAILCSIMFATFALAQKIQIEHVTIISMDGNKVHEDATLAIEGDRIVYVGPADKAPQLHGTHSIIDGTGKFLLPGLVEMHGHLPAAGWDKDRTEETLFLYLAGGVTTVRGMLGDPVQFDLREKITSGDIAGPTLYLAAPSLNGRSVSSVDEAIAKTKQYAAEGWDLQKLHGGLAPEEYEAIATTAKALNYPFGGHVSADVGVEASLDAGQISIDHLDGFLTWLGGDKHELTDAELQKAVDSTKASNTWVVPTQALMNMFLSGGDLGALLARPENRYVSKETVAAWQERVEDINKDANPLLAQNRQRLIKALVDGGAKVAMGSDAPQVFSVPGFSIWREIETLKDAGLTNNQILALGTSAAGLYFADKDRFGAIKVGARADMILLNADPRENIMNITKQAGVMTGGRWYSRQMIDKRLEDISKRHGN